MPSTAARYFANYTRTPARVPDVVWMALRLATLAITLGLAWCLLTTRWGLTLFWGFAIPVVPALVVIAPGLWRQICPMALTNQLPVLSGCGLARDLPGWARQWAFTIAVALFVTIVGLRAPVLNHNGALVGAGIVGVLVLGFAGGYVFKGRSGWCGTFCPLGPIQRDYGHAPLVLVRNGYCRPCVGCQKNCYDFNPRAAVFEDLYDSDPTYSGQRRFFMAMMPGMVLGYYLQAPGGVYSFPVSTGIFLGGIAVSVGLYQAILSFGRLNPFRTASLFASAAVAEYYFFAAPVIFATLHSVMGLGVADGVTIASRFTGVVIAGALCYRGWMNERLYKKGSEQAQQLSVDQTSRSLRDRLAGTTAALVTDAETGTAFPVGPNQSLLEAMEAARISVEFGCRAGLCGADAVIIRSGSENLSAPGEDERATLRRLGLDGVCRLACMCRVRGQVVIDRNVESAQRFFAGARATASSADPLKAKGISRVVVVGNGVAGVTVADTLRRESASAEITVVTDEPYHFYNRMAVGRAVYGRAAMDGLMLLPESWYPEHKIEVWRNTVAEGIDRRARALRLATGETLPYDALVLATGADPVMPLPEYAQFPNCFVLRTAADALAVRMWAQRNAAHGAVVIGGGVLGVEAADALRLLGMRVTLLHRASRLMDRQLDEQGADRLGQYLANIGIEVRTEAAVTGLSGGRQLDAVVLQDGSRIVGDFFLACIGVRPRTSLAGACGLEVGRGIKVDSFMRSSDPAIYAVGDVAEVPEAPSGFWPIATAQAAACVAGMLGRAEGYHPPRLFVQLKCDGIDLRSYGDLETREGDEVIYSREEMVAWWRVVLRDGALASAVLVGPPGSGRDFGRLIQTDADLAPVLSDLRQGRIEALARV